MRKALLITMCAGLLATGLASVSTWNARAVANSPAAGRFVPVGPVRVVDTREALGAVGPLAPAATITVSMAAAVPLDALAVAFNLTVTSPERSGWVTVWPAGTEQPVASNLNVEPYEVSRANFVTLALPADRRVSLFNHAGGHLVLDVAGYWEPAVSATAGRFNAVAPTRVLDTRGALGGHPGKLAAGETYRLALAGGPSGVPAGASAVAVTVTAHDTASPGWVTTFPDGVKPISSTLNFAHAGRTVPNMAIVPLAQDGSVQLYTSAATHLIVDVTGWFSGSGAADAATGLFVALPPKRIADSRLSLGLDRLARSLFDELVVLGSGADAVPASGVGAVALNLTITRPYAAGWLTAYPGRTEAPLTSSLNFRESDNVAGLTVVAVGANGTVAMASPVGTDVVVDVAGWFTGVPAPAGVGVAAVRHCRHLMAFLHRDDPNSSSFGARVRDLSGATPDIAVTVPGGSSVGALRWAPNCEYLVVAVVSSVDPPRYDYLRYDNPARAAPPVRLASNRLWRGLAVSSDAHFVYFYGRTDETFGDVVDVYDNRSESSRPSLSRTPPRTIGLISAASQTNGDLYVTGTTTGTTLLKLYRCGLGSLPANCVVVAGRGEGVHDVSVREDLPGGTRYGYADSAGAFVEVGAATRKLLHAGAIQVRLTWQGDAVTSARPDNAQPGIWRFDLDANANTIKQTKLLDNVLDGAPAFSWPWSP